MDKEKIRPFYSEFPGYLSQAPEPKKPDDIIDNESLWNQYNSSVDLLKETSGVDYSRFKIEAVKGPPIEGFPAQYIGIALISAKIGRVNFSPSWAILSGRTPSL